MHSKAASQSAFGFKSVIRIFKLQVLLPGHKRPSHYLPRKPGPSHRYKYRFLLPSDCLGPSQFPLMRMQQAMCAVQFRMTAWLKSKNEDKIKLNVPLNLLQESSQLHTIKQTFGAFPKTDWVCGTMYFVPSCSSQIRLLLKTRPFKCPIPFTIKPKQ